MSIAWFESNQEAAFAGYFRDGDDASVASLSAANPVVVSAAAAFTWRDIGRYLHLHLTTADYPFWQQRQIIDVTVEGAVLEAPFAPPYDGGDAQSGLGWRVTATPWEVIGTAENVTSGVVVDVVAYPPDIPEEIWKSTTGETPPYYGIFLAGLDLPAAGNVPLGLTSTTEVADRLRNETFRITVEALWLGKAAGLSDYGLFGSPDADGGDRGAIYLEYSGTGSSGDSATVSARRGNFSGGPNILLSGVATIFADEWVVYQLDWDADTNTLELRIDGVLVGSGSAALDPLGAGVSMLVGSAGVGDPATTGVTAIWNGLFRNVTVWFVETTYDPPTCVPHSYSTAYHTLLTDVAPGLLSGASGDVGSELAAFEVGKPENGELAIVPDGTFGYLPNYEFFGVDTFQYAVRDTVHGLYSDPATVTVTVGAPAYPPLPPPFAPGGGIGGPAAKNLRLFAAVTLDGGTGDTDDSPAEGITLDDISVPLD